MHICSAVGIVDMSKTFWQQRLHDIRSWLVLDSSPPILCFYIFYHVSGRNFLRFGLGMKICHLLTLVGGDGEILVVDLKREPGGLGVLLEAGGKG